MCESMDTRQRKSTVEMTSSLSVAISRRFEGRQIIRLPRAFFEGIKKRKKIPFLRYEYAYVASVLLSGAHRTYAPTS